MMDNLAVHRAMDVDEALQAVGARAWFLPPYSPDFNPIEQAWSSRLSRWSEPFARSILVGWQMIVLVQVVVSKGLAAPCGGVAYCRSPIDSHFFPSLRGKTRSHAWST